MNEVKPQEEVLFVCNAYPMLRMQVKADDVVLIAGVPVKTRAHWIGFIKTEYGGQFATSDPVEIAYVRKSPQFMDGLIVEVDAKARRAPMAATQAVHQGAIDSGAREVPPPAPAAKEPQAAHAVRVPGRSTEAPKKPVTIDADEPFPGS